MRPLGRQVQHVAGLQHKLFFGLEVRKNLEWHIGLQRKIFLATNAPAALAMGLQQEHVIAVEMRTHAALVGGKADHQIIESRFWHKAELLQKLMHLGVVQIHALHQSRPAGLGQRGQAATGQRAMLEAPATISLLLNQARLHAVFTRHCQQTRAGNRCFEAGNGLAHQQGLFVPVLAHELRGGEPTEQGERRIDVHEMSPAVKATDCILL